MTLAEIAQSYRDAEATLDARIEELELRAEENPGEAEALAGRLLILKAMKREVRTVGNICEHYYERSYHPNERYTVQQTFKRGSRRLAKVAGRSGGDQRGSTGKTLQTPANRDPGRADTEAAGLLADVLLRPKNHENDRRRTGRRHLNRKQDDCAGGKGPVPGTEVLPLRGEEP